MLCSIYDVLISKLQDLFWNIKSNTSMNEKDKILLLKLTDSIVGQPTGTVENNTTSSRGITTASNQESTNIPKLRKPSSNELLPQTGKRVRKEYRLLTKEEKARFHGALNMMAMVRFN